VRPGSSANRRGAGPWKGALIGLVHAAFVLTPISVVLAQLAFGVVLGALYTAQ
jgi:hypothetical protein